MFHHNSLLGTLLTVVRCIVDVVEYVGSSIYVSRSFVSTHWFELSCQSFMTVQIQKICFDRLVLDNWNCIVNGGLSR